LKAAGLTLVSYRWRSSHIARLCTPLLRNRCPRVGRLGPESTDRFLESHCDEDSRTLCKIAILRQYHTKRNELKGLSEMIDLATVPLSYMRGTSFTSQQQYFLLCIHNA
jgi:hypothetical protein